jgi:hypothetical protein
MSVAATAIEHFCLSNFTDSYRARAMSMPPYVVPDSDV